jgi:hypothetical protein
MANLDDDLLREVLDYLDEILEEDAVRFVHLERGELIDRIERIRTAAEAARYVLRERRSLRL